MKSRQLLLLVLVLQLLAPLGNGEDPYAVLGVKKTASDLEIRKAYHSLALKWHPDKNPGNPHAEQQFMRIKDAYDRLTKTPGAAEQERERRQQSFYRQQQQYQYQKRSYGHQYRYQYQQRWDLSHLTTPFFLMIGLAVVAGLLHLGANTNGTGSSQEEATRSASTEEEIRRESPLKQLAKVFAPSIYELSPLYLTARGRRTLVFFPDDTRHDCSVRDQFSIIETLATEFHRDPLTFCWLDLKTQPVDKRVLWEAQFGEAPAPFVAGLGYRGKKCSLLPPCTSSTSTGRRDLEEVVRKWLLRLAGGEVSQEPSVPGLF
uniref:J domain-containing protein n=1 Tax=Peronospora matthiolae TaxID=2874970 RepID=A0AAV1TRY1_9STRA